MASKYSDLISSADDHVHSKELLLRRLECVQANIARRQQCTVFCTPVSVRFTPYPPVHYVFSDSQCILLFTMYPLVHNVSSGSQCILHFTMCTPVDNVLFVECVWIMIDQDHSYWSQHHSPVFIFGCVIIILNSDVTFLFAFCIMGYMK